jgi:hypothetical protein
MEAEMKKFFTFLVCLSLLVLTSCGGGNGGNEGTAEKSDENSASEEEIEENNDASPEKPDDENCIVSERYGVNFSRKSSRDMCISSMVKALHPGCSWQESEESIAKHLNGMSKLEVRFLEEAGSVAGTSRKMCYYPVEDDWFKCPAFLPNSLTFNWFAGCEVYSVVPESDCTAPCADVYYWTDDFWFPVISVGADKDGGDFIKSVMYDGEAYFTAEFKLGKGEATVLWTDSENGVETERKAIAPIEIGEEEVPDLDCFWLGKDLRCY